MTPKTSKPTMCLIAKKLDISINAVSLALNGRPGISNNLKNEILKYADEIGYFELKPKYTKTFKENNFCLILEKKHYNDFYFYSNAVKSIENETRNLGFDLIIKFADLLNYTIPSCIINRKISGILILGTFPDKYLRLIFDQKIPTVLVDNMSLYYSTDCILNNNKSGCYKAVKFLIKNDIFDIGFFGDVSYSQSIKDRFFGFQEAMLEFFDYDYKKMIETIMPVSILSNVEQDIIQKNIANIEDKLTMLPRLPKAFLCSNDNGAEILIKALKNLGYNTPNDISIIGFDNNENSEFVKPALTTLNVDTNLMGLQAVKRLNFRIKNKNHPAEIIVLETKLIIRDSVLIKKEE